MKLTKTALKRLIREEVSKELSGDPLEDLIQQSYEKEDDALAVQRRQMFDVLGDKSASPDEKRRTINKALKDGLFGDPKSPEAKKEWRRLRRKHHKRKKWAGALSKDPRANAIDQAEKLYRKGKRAEAKKAAKWWLKKNPNAGGNYGRIARQIISAPD